MLFYKKWPQRLNPRVDEKRENLLQVQNKHHPPLQEFIFVLAKKSIGVD
jgi:hypothetical protein